MINEEIRSKELRVIDTDGSQLGIMSRQEALDISEEKKLDLVCISPKANPPVCKILDYGKYKYELQKKEKEAKKKQKTTQVKEIRLSTFIEDHDIMVKAKTGSKSVSYTHLPVIMQECLRLYMTSREKIQLKYCFL